MEFWGVEVKAGEPLKVKSDDDKLVHLSVACLGELKKGKEDDSVSLFVSVNDQKIVIGILSPKKRPQISFDLVFDTDFELSHNWKNGSIYFTGYKFSYSELENDPSVPKENGKFEVKKEQSSIPAVKIAAAKTETSSAKPITKSVEPKKEDNPEDDSDSDEEDSDSDEEDSDSDEKGIAAMLGSSSTKSGTKIVDAKKDDSTSDEEDTDSDEEDSDSDEEGSDSDEEGVVAKLGSSITTPVTKPMQPKKEGKPLDDSDSDRDEEDSEDEDIEFNGDESSSEDFDDDDLDDSDDELTTKKEISSRKRPAGSAPMIPVPVKKAKLITPQKIGSDSKKDGVHVATPYPSKQAGRGTGASNKSKQLKPKQRSGK